MKIIYSSASLEGYSVTSIGNSVFSDCDSLILTVAPGSFGERFAQKNNISYTYGNSNMDWLLG